MRSGRPAVELVWVAAADESPAFDTEDAAASEAALDVASVADDAVAAIREDAAEDTWGVAEDMAEEVVLEDALSVANETRREPRISVRIFFLFRVFLHDDVRVAGGVGSHIVEGDHGLARWRSLFHEQLHAGNGYRRIGDRRIVQSTQAYLDKSLKRSEVRFPGVMVGNFSPGSILFPSKSTGS